MSVGEEKSVFLLPSWFSSWGPTKLDWQKPREQGKNKQFINT